MRAITRLAVTAHVELRDRFDRARALGDDAGLTIMEKLAITVFSVGIAIAVGAVLGPKILEAAGNINMK